MSYLNFSADQFNEIKNQSKHLFDAVGDEPGFQLAAFKNATTIAAAHAEHPPQFPGLYNVNEEVKPASDSVILREIARNTRKGDVKLVVEKPQPPKKYEESIIDDDDDEEDEDPEIDSLYAQAKDVINYIDSSINELNKSKTRAQVNKWVIATRSGIEKSREILDRIDNLELSNAFLNEITIRERVYNDMLNIYGKPQQMFGWKEEIEPTPGVSYTEEDYEYQKLPSDYEEPLGEDERTGSGNTLKFHSLAAAKHHLEKLLDQLSLGNTNRIIPAHIKRLAVGLHKKKAISKRQRDQILACI